MRQRNKPAIGVIGGTGEGGTASVRVWSDAGDRVVISARVKEKAEAAPRALGRSTVRGDHKRGAARAAAIPLPQPSDQ